MATQNLFKKVSVFMKKNPNVSRKDAFAIVQGKKKVTAAKLGAAKKTVKVSIAGKKRPSNPLPRQGAPALRSSVAYRATTPKESLPALTKKIVDILKQKLGTLEANRYMAKTIKERNKIAKEISEVKKQLRKFL